MQHARVSGRVTSTVRHPSLAGSRLIVCDVLGNDGRTAAGDPVLAIDRYGARTGDHVIISSDGKGMRELLGDQNSPARWFTLGIVDGRQLQA